MTSEKTTAKYPLAGENAATSYQRPRAAENCWNWIDSPVSATRPYRPIQSAASRSIPGSTSVTRRPRIDSRRSPVCFSKAALTSRNT